MRIRSSLASGVLTAALTAAVIGAADTPAAAEPAEEQGLSGLSLCQRAQVNTASLRLVRFHRAGGEFAEVPYTDLAAFAASKPQVRPLTVTSYITYDDTGVPRQVRCKGKSADHINQEYGDRTAGANGTCGETNRRTLWRVARDLTRAERDALVYRPYQVTIDPDTPAATGQDWLADFPTATVDSGGTLHLPSKSLHVPLDTPGIPDAFKGQHYCTLIAPEHLKRILLGTVPAS
ncbi:MULTISPECIES: hypothetical protein [unclassified Nocardia]|uniref:hypothetical protein n=1 Tax=unclassified Nocardia TaxID=2637762 RepID=UPI00278C8177|nr:MULTISPECIES: hypothetical protein [unclassified Nocardia]